MTGQATEILYVEDGANDVELTLRALRRCGIDYEKFADTVAEHQ